MKKQSTLITVIILIIGVLIAKTMGTTERNDSYSVSFVNVGQGDGAAIQTPDGENIVIDFGNPASGSGKTPLVNFLLSSRIYSIGKAFLSHYHEDHGGGLFNLDKNVMIERIYLPAIYGESGDTETNSLYEKIMKETAGIEKTYLETGNVIEIDENFKIEVLFLDGDNSDENDNSVIMVATIMDKRFLFTGDATVATEDRLLALYQDGELKADVLKIAHHGSRFSTSDRFLDAVDPNYAVISVGTNSYGHPTESVLSRLGVRKIETYRTDKNATVTFYINKDGYMEVEKMR